MTQESEQAAEFEQAKRWLPQIKGKLLAENVSLLTDDELDRILSPCVAGNRLVPMAIMLRDAGLLTL